LPYDIIAIDRTQDLSRCNC